MNKVLTGLLNPVLSCAVGLTLIGSGNIAQAASFVLYDGSQGTTPNTSNPQWLAFRNLGGTQTYNNAIALNDPEPVSVPEPAAILGLLSLMAGGTFKKSRNEEKTQEKTNSGENKERSQNKEV